MPMDDPTRRPPGAWPRDRPIRWGGVATGLGWFLLTTFALILQLLLAIPILLFDSLLPGRVDPGAIPIVLALVWGALTLFAAWSWILGRWRVVVVPLVTGAAIGLGVVIASSA